MLATIARRVRHLVLDADGPTAVEYAVMLALVVLVCLAAVMTVGSSTNRLFTNANNSISSATGS